MNHSTFPAKGLIIQYDYPLHIHELLGVAQTRLISINDPYPKSICILEDDFDRMGNGYPKRVVLGFLDVDNNFIYQTSSYTTEGYEAGPWEYM